MECLEEFGKRKINLCKLESRPRRRFLGSTGFSYVFYLDFEGHYEDDNVAAALLSLLSKAAFVKLQGSYPMAPGINGEANQTSVDSSILQI